MPYISTTNRGIHTQRISKKSALLLEQIIGKHDSFNPNLLGSLQFYEIEPAQVLEIIFESDTPSDIGKILVRPLFQDVSVQNI